MTEQLPRPIEPGEALRKGQRVRGCAPNYPYPGIDTFMEFAVDYEHDGKVYAADSGPHGASYNRGNYLWTLIADAPTPAPAVGSRWRDPETEVRYIYAANGVYRVYDAPNGLSMDHDRWLGLHPNETSSVPIVARLQPIPDHGTGCSPWLWDKTTQTAWVAGSVDGAVSHIQVAGIKTHAGYLEHNREDAELAADLRPYSERGQANG